MEENNLNAPENNPIPAEKNVISKSWPFSRILLAAAVGLYFIAFIPAFIIISKNESARPKLEQKDVSEDFIIKKNAVAVIPVKGAIYQDMSSSVLEKGSDLISSKIRKMAKDKNVKAIVLDINSPGGSVGAVQDIYSTIIKMKAETKKPFVAHFGDVSASGGYYIASACDKILAQSGTITGSIGVIFSAVNLEGLFKKIGYRDEVIKSGKFKDIGSMSREMTKEERALLQGMIDDSYQDFLEAVSSGRRIPKEKLKDIADGRVFTGRQAVKVGLVDRIGDLQDAISEAGIMSGLGQNPPVTRSKSYGFSDFFDLLDSRLNFFGNVKNLKTESPLLEYRWAGF